MQSYNSIKCSEISDGQYTVTIDLQNFQNKIDLYKFKIKLKELSNDCAEDISGIYKLDGNKLVYKSETLLPLEGCGNKPKVLIVYGNPAFHSVKNGMFFFSKANNHSHSMWGKLQKANLIKPVRFSDDNLFLARKREAEERKKLISAGKSPDMFSLGMTTFYSFPTPVKGRFRDVRGVEKLFKPVLKDIISFEAHRIQNYAFTQDAILVFVQKSSYEAFMRHSGQNALFWPLIFKNSSGEYLYQKLKDADAKSDYNPCNLPAQ
jgi:hypothetical protein